MKWPRIAPLGASSPRTRHAPREPFARRFFRAVRRVLLVFSLGMIAMAGYFAWQRVHAFVYRSDFFQIDPAQIEITGATEPLERDARTRILADLPDWGENLVRLDADRLALRLESLPRAHAAEVRKHYPQGLTVSLREREPLMVLNLGRPWLIDREGVVLDTANPKDLRRLALPVLTGIKIDECKPGDQITQERLKEIVDAVEFLRDHDRPVNARIAEWNLSELEGITAILTGGAAVRFGAYPPLELLDKLSLALAKKGPALEQARYIDLRMEHQVVYNMRTKP